MQKEKGYIQHGRFSVYAHSFLVASLCVYIAEKLRLKLDTRSLVRGALLHDYFLYDWHTPTNPTDFTLFPTPDARLKTRGGIFV